MTILVTGASGIVGRPLVDHLVARGDKVVGLCRHPAAGDTAGVRWLAGDVSKPRLGLADSEWHQLCREVTAIFHLAARTDFKGSGLEDYRPVNIDGVRHVKELAMVAGAWLHHVSTAFVCGEWDGIFREEHLAEGQRFHNHYEESKYLGECILREEPTPRYTVYRPSIILERKPGAASTSVFGPFVFLDGVFRLCLGAIKRQGQLQIIRVAGNPRAHLPFVFDDQLSRTLADLAADKAVHGKTYHLVPAEPFANQRLQDVFNQAFSGQVVAWVDAAALDRESMSIEEKILEKKTRMYSPYLDLRTTFARDNLESSLGLDVLPAPEEEELLAAFAAFLSAKKELETVISHNQQFHLDRYFKQFLPQHMGKPLIRNLKSLSACLQVEIKGYDTWTLTIEEGVLASVAKGAFGSFGYITDGKTFLQVVCGRISPQQGFFKGAIQLLANPREALRTATALEEFFHDYPYHL